MAETKNTLPDEVVELIRVTVREAVADALAATGRALYPADAKTEQRTIRHALFSYDLPGGGNKVAMRGETVSLLPHDVARGEKFDAFTQRVGDEPEAPSASKLPAFPADGSEQDHDAWVDSGSVPEIIDAVNADPAIAQLVIDAEARRGEKSRKTLLDALAKSQAANA